MKKPNNEGGHYFEKMDKRSQTPSNTLKIFVCSTQSDMEWERRKLWEDVLLELQNEMRVRGMRVTLVDMYLGAQTDPVYDRHAFDEYLSEMRDAHYNSAGPFFLCMIGDKYGPAPLPRRLTVEQFQVIQREAFNTRRDVRLLQQWYIIDNNALPPAYLLQPITAKYKNYGQGDKQSLMEAQTWEKEFHLLQDIFQSTWHALPAADKTQVDSVYSDGPFSSGVSEQIQLALKQNPENVFVMKRTLQNVDLRYQQVEKYVNIVSKTKTISKEDCEKLVGLCEHLKTHLNERNMAHFMVPWGPTGFNPLMYEEHVQYLEGLQAAVVTWLVGRVDVILNNRMANMPVAIDDEERKLEIELRAHMAFYGNVAGTHLCDFDKIEEQLTELVKENMMKGHQVLVLKGPEGTGKTSLLVRWFGQLRTRFGADCVLIIRFIGLTACSSSPDELLRSLCVQLKVILKRCDNIPTLTDNALVCYFFDLLDEIAGMSQQFFFIIDGMEKLRAPVEGSEIHFWEGIAAAFPPNVHFIVSFTISTSNVHLLDRLTNQISSEMNLITTPNLSPQALKDVILHTLMENHRTLTTEQLSVLQAAIQPRSTPLYVKLLVQESLLWTSQTVLNGVGLPCSLEEALLNRFEVLETQYGEELLSVIARYISSSHYGLTEHELLDVLSCNNDIMLSVYHFELPNVIRFPHSLWSRIRNGMALMIEERNVDGETLFYWAHTTIANTAISRYFTNSEEIKRSHQDISDLYLDTWVGNKPMVVPSLNLQIIDTGCRYVSQQPLVFNETQYNYRRLDELWYQLLHAGNLDKFKEHTFCNFEYLLARVHSTSIHSLVADFKNTSCQVLDGEIHLVLQCLLLGLDTISKDPLQLASQLIGRLRQVKDQFPDHIDTLVQQCMEWCDSYSLPLVVPLSSWLSDPRIPLVQTIEEPDDIYTICSTRNSQHVFCATSRNEIKMYHIPSKKLIKTLIGHRAQITCLRMSSSNRYLVSGSEDCSVRIWHLAKGKAVQIIGEHTDAIICLTLTMNDDIIITGSRDHKFRVISMSTGEVIHTNSAHQGAIVSVILNSNDSILATGSEDKQVRIWDMDDFTELYVIDDDIPSPIICMGLTSDNTFLLIGCEDGSLRVKSFTTGSSIHKLEGHVGKVGSIALSTDCYHAAAGCSDGNVYVYNLRTRELLDGFSGHAYSITSVCCSSNQHFIFTAAKDKINVWTFYRRHTHTIMTDEHTRVVTCVNVSRDGKSAITGAKDKTARIWHLTDPWSSDYKRLMTCKADATGSGDTSDDEVGVEYVDVTDRQRRARQSSVHSDTEVRSILSTRSTTRRGSNNTSRVQWDHPVAKLQLRKEEELDSRSSTQDSLRTSRAGIPGRRLSHPESGDTLMSYGTETDPGEEEEEDRMLSVYGADTPRRKSLSAAPERRQSTWREAGGLVDPFDSGGATRRQSHLAGWGSRAAAATSSVVQEIDYIKEEAGTPEQMGGSDQVVKLWNLDICDFSADLVGHTAPVTAVALADDEAFAVSGSEDCTVKVWSIMMGCVITDYKEHQSTITAIEVLADNVRVLSVEADGFIKMWSAGSGETTMCLSGPTGLLKLSPNSQYAVSGEYNNTRVKIWSVKDGSLVQDIAHTETVTCVAYSPDSQYVVTGSEDMSLKVWEVATGKLTQVLVEHENTVSCVAVTNSNRYIISGSHDHSLLVWCLETGVVEHKLQGHTDHVTVVKVTLDGTVAVSGSKDGTLRVWGVAYGQQITTFDLHKSVTDLHLTDKAAHLVVRVKDSLHVPLLCLHNSPSGEIKSQSEVSFNMLGGYPILPLKPQPPLNQTNISVFPVPKNNRNTLKRDSVSTIPEIIKVTPIRLPISVAVKVQERNRETRHQMTVTKATSTTDGSKTKDNQEQFKKSSVCNII